MSNTNTSKVQKVSAAEVTEQLKTTAATVTTANAPTISSAAKSLVTPVKLPGRQKIRRTREQILLGALDTRLENYYNAAIGSAAKIKALSDVVAYIKRNPTNANLEKVYKFFVAHKNEEFLDPAHALQRHVILDKDSNLQVRLFWRVMYALAHGTASRKHISLNMLQTVYRNDDLVNWIAAKMNQLNRASRGSKK